MLNPVCHDSLHGIVVAKCLNLLCSAAQVDRLRGLHLEGWELDNHACLALSELTALGVLRLSECNVPSLQPPMSLTGLPSLRWLGLQGPAACAAGEASQCLQLQARFLHTSNFTVPP